MNKNPMDAAVENCVNATRDALLAPDSLIIYQIYATSALSSERDEEIWMEADTQEEYEDIVSQESDDIIKVYIYYGATNRGGGISDTQYMYICDIDGNITDSMTYEEYENSEQWSTRGEVMNAWLSFHFSQLYDSLDESYIDYSEKYK